MLLKSIDLQGYKTFAGRTVFEFAGAITCIVGPNGSGKSNIADSIRWVLGEQSYSLLRGKKTEDMIFSGSEIRSRSGMASTNIIFDNTTGWLPIDFSEVSIARRAYRDGRNEYLINGQRVRLKDISELLSSSGLSERTYTIIGQGLVDAALALRVEERRRLFEEAAGIGIYRARRREAERRLESTQRNLERVEDILSELKPRVRSLEIQARKAAQFDQVENDLKELLRDYYGYHWYKAQVDLRASREAARNEEETYEKVQQDQEGLNTKLSSFREKILELRSNLSTWHRESSILHNNRGEISRELAVTDERIRSLFEQQHEIKLELPRAEEQSETYEKRFEESKLKVEELKGKLAETQAQIVQSVQVLESRQNEHNIAEKSFKETSNTMQSLGKQLTHLQARETEKRFLVERQTKSLDEAVEKLAETHEKSQAVNEKLVTAKSSYNILDERLKKVKHEHLILQNEILDNEELILKTQKEKSSIDADLAKLVTELNVLEESDQKLLGYENGTKLLVSKLRSKGEESTQGIFGTSIEVPEEFETAIVSALGEYLDAVFTKDDDFTKEALEILINNKTRGTILPIERIKSPPQTSLPNIKGVINIASKVVKAPKDLQAIVDLLLGDTIIVENRKIANEVLSGKQPYLKAVTLKGEVFHSGGPITVGNSGHAISITRPRKKRNLSKEIGELESRGNDTAERIKSLTELEHELKTKETEISANLQDLLKRFDEEHNNYLEVEIELSDLQRDLSWQNELKKGFEADIQSSKVEVDEIQNSISELEKQLGEARKNLDQQQSRLDSLSLDEIEAKVVHWNTQYTVIEQALLTAENQFSDRNTALDDITNSKNQLYDKLSSYTQTLDELDLRKKELKLKDDEIAVKIDEYNALIKPVELELSEVEAKQNELQMVVTESRQVLGQSFRQFSKTQLELSRQEEKFYNLRDHIEDDLGLVMFEYDENTTGQTPLPLDGIVEKLPHVDELPDGMEKTIRRQRTQVKRMGGINPDAQAEFREVKERFDFMTEQIEDLKSAEKDVKLVIAELDTIMEQEFISTFEQVAVEFKEIFTRLFGGGAAQLILTDPENINESGIDIIAKLPGRRDQGLSLLSGGERSLTATALVFSLLKVSPTPFCVLDEVDAMLDEANVGRFRDLLSELAANTQFIVITHNRNTVQAADVIYGVTMGRDSASQVVSLKLDEVNRIV